MAMRKLLAVTISVLTFMVASSFNFNLGPGLSAKNLFMYLPGVILLLQAVLGQRPKGGLLFLQGCWAVLILYSLVSIVIVGTFGTGYRDYSILPNILFLKSNFFDWWVLFSVFFYGPRSLEDTERLIKVLLIAIGIANVITILVVGGLPLRTDIVDVSDDGTRIAGFFGHPNETGTMIACLIPAYIAVIESSGGIRKWGWIGCLVASATVMILNQSRGATVAFFIGGLWGIALCRRYLSLQRAIKWIYTTAAIMVPVVLVLGIKYWYLLLDRLNAGKFHGDVSYLTSGRTDIWGDGLNSMMERPWSFVTGLGYNSWPSLTTIGLAEHNQFLAFWFELGLTGLIVFIVILGTSATTALSAAAVAEPKTRGYVVACVFSVLILCVGMAFANLGMPWFFLWPYLGLMTRYACFVLADNRRLAAARSQPASQPSPSRRAHSSGASAATRMPPSPVPSARQLRR
jgi:hypothetical protein